MTEALAWELCNGACSAAKLQQLPCSLVSAHLTCSCHAFLWCGLPKADAAPCLQGPFSRSDILAWFDDGFFPADLPICTAGDSEKADFRPLSVMMRVWAGGAAGMRQASCVF